MSYLIFLLEAFNFYLNPFINPFLKEFRRKVFLFNINTLQAFERIDALNKFSSGEDFCSDRLLHIDCLLNYEILRQTVFEEDMRHFFGVGKISEIYNLNVTTEKCFDEQESILTALKMLKILEMAKEYKINPLSKDMKYISEFIDLIEEVENDSYDPVEINNMFENLKQLLLEQKYFIIHQSNLDLIGIRQKECLAGIISEEEYREFLVNTPTDMYHRLQLEGLGRLHQEFLEKGTAANLTRELTAKGMTNAELLKSLLLAKSGDLNENWIDLLKKMSARGFLSKNKDSFSDD